MLPAKQSRINTLEKCLRHAGRNDTLKFHRGLTNGQRGRISLDFKKAGLWRGRPFKALTSPKKRTGGRNNSGRITCRHRGGGAKQRYRIIDFKRQLWDVPATVERLEYDPNRSAFIAKHIEQPGSRHSNPASRKTMSRPSSSACSFTNPDPGTTIA